MNKYTKVAAHALIKKDDKYLVTHRAKTDDYMPGYWDVPGGTIEFGEGIIDALKRELQEEISMEVEIGNVISVCGYLSDESRHQFQLVYACRYIAGIPKLDADCHDEFRWVTLTKMAKLKKIKFLKQLYSELKNG